MRIQKILIELKIEEKINKKHGIYRKEIEDALFEGKPIFYKAKENKYFAVGHKEKYITIVFLYQEKDAVVVTAYPSSEWQIKLYKRKKK